MAKSDIEDIEEQIKSDLANIDTAIDELVQEARARTGNMTLKYHDLSAPLTKLLSSKQKATDQLIKLIELKNKVYDDEVTLDMDDMYSQFEVKKENK